MLNDLTGIYDSHEALKHLKVSRPLNPRILQNKQTLTDITIDTLTLTSTVLTELRKWVRLLSTFLP